MEKILIVEDDIAFGTMIQTWLRKKGFEVEKTTSVKAAIQVCEEAERGFDLVLSDLRLPDHDGIFLLQWMRKAWRAGAFHRDDQLCRNSECGARNEIGRYRLCGKTFPSGNPSG